MDEQSFNTKDIFKVMQAQSNFEILPCDYIADIDSKPGYVKIGLTDSQKIQVSGLMAQMPAVAATGAMAQLYSVSFPEGVTGTLMKLGKGGVGSPIIENGKIVAWASFNEMGTQAALFGAFNILSIASGQYFLSKINNEMKMINQSIDKILEFLYGDKKRSLCQR